ncbi:MAG TPA: DUF4062 domain-containing protein, partial [Saprospiraceae bacterium]|nr:DUF4062 domain-containing protein [Saprospiraceae bacterium]
MFQKIKIFISSVQSEFAQERAELIEYINGDSLLGRYFDPFIFEQLPAANISAEQAYLSQVSFSEIYIGILGENYGSENEQGISPTELEYNKATALHKTRLIYLKDTEEPRIHPKLSKFIKKVQNEVVRKKFYALNDLKTQVYKSLIHYLEYKELIVTVPFDASDSNLTLHDIDEDRIAWFMQIARSKRGLPQKIGNSTRELLIHLHLLDNEKLSKAAILLFGKDPQKLVIQSEVRCAHFHGKIVEKPIPSYKVFKGDIFQLIDEAVDFVLSKLDYKIETRALTNAIPGSYEIPRAIVSEAIVNAIAHRDYTSKGSVQVMLFEDRLEIWNPGQLPMGWGISKLKEPHGSVPYNPLIADALYLAGYIERMGTGTSDIYRLAAFNGLAEPKFIQAEEFKTIIY